jgi:hypothetical protein
VTRYWLRDWVDAEEIKTLEQVRERLQDRRSLDRLVSSASNEAAHPVSPKPEVAQQLVAGRGMNLTGEFDCSSVKCMQKRIDELLYRAWHYFDTVLVTGLESRRFLRRFQEDRVEALGLVIKHVAVLLYIKEIGADDCIVFSERPHYCLDCLNVNALNAGMVDDVEEVSKRVAQRLKNSCQVSELVETSTGLKCSYSAGGEGWW